MQNIVATKPSYPWLSKTLFNLQKMVNAQKFPHALLCVGQEGLGKEALVNALSQLLLCREPKNERACGDCTACRLYQEQHHPDFRSLGDNNAHISIDEIREVIDFLSQAPHQAGNRVVVIAASHLSVACANALLKTLEEPPSKTYFILTAKHSAAVLPTVRSRCFVVNLPIPAFKDAVSWLEQQAGQASENLPWLLKIAGGAPLKAQHYSAKTLDKDLAIIIELLHSLDFSFYHRDDTQRWLMSDTTEALYLLYYWLTELIRYVATGTTVFTPSAAANFAPLAHLSGKALVVFLDKVLDALQMVKTPGVNKSLLLEALMYEWHILRRSNQ